VEQLGGSPGSVPPGSPGRGASDAANNAHLLHELGPFPRPVEGGVRLRRGWRALPQRWSRRRRKGGRGDPPAGGAATASDTILSSSSPPSEGRWRSFLRREEPDQPPGPRPPGADRRDEDRGLLLFVAAGPGRRYSAIPGCRCRMRHSVYYFNPLFFKVGTLAQPGSASLWSRGSLVRIQSSDQFSPQYFM